MIPCPKTAVTSKTHEFFGSGDFACYDFAGKQIWHFNVQERYNKKFSMYHGVHVSPIKNQGKSLARGTA